MYVEFSPHAELKIGQRKLLREKIIETALHPDMQRPGHSGRMECFKNFGKNFMKVITVSEPDKLTIVTAHWVAKIPKK